MMMPSVSLNFMLFKEDEVKKKIYNEKAANTTFSV